MSEIIFLNLDEINEIHELQVAEYGGLNGTRDSGLLTSAVEMPKASFGGEFLHEDIYEMAAAYLFHIVQNHHYLDGNKRVGLHAALVFLELNHVVVEAPDEKLTALVLEVAQGHADKKQITKFFKKYS